VKPGCAKSGRASPSTRQPFKLVKVIAMIKTASQWIALGAVVGPIPFTLAWAMLGALRPGYSAISEPISLLGVGPHGLILDASFVITALLLIVGLVGAILNVGGMSVVSRSVSIVLLSLSPIGLAICGLFTADTPSVHYPAVALATGTPIVSFAVVGLLMLRVPGWRRFGAWLILASPLTLALTWLVTIDLTAMRAGATGGVGGLTERILAVEIFAWFVALGWLGFRAAPNTNGNQASDSIH